LFLAMLATPTFTPALQAGTISDVSGQTTVLVKTGESLAFDIFIGSFGKNSLALGLPAYPTEITFALISLPLTRTGSFSAWLQSGDDSVTVDFNGPLTFHDGTFAGAKYQGVDSTLQGYLTLTPELSQDLFDNSGGPDIEIGLDPYNLRQSLFISLAEGPLSQGGIVGSANLEEAAQVKPGASRNGFKLASVSIPGAPLAPVVTPEPGSARLFLAGGTLLCGLSAVISRISKRRS
jgi:hypothetical protein